MSMEQVKGIVNKAKEDMEAHLREGESVSIVNDDGSTTKIAEGKPKGVVQKNLKGEDVADVLVETEEKETRTWTTSKFVLKIDKEKYADEVRPLDSYQRLSFIRGHMKPLPKVNKVHGVMKGDVDAHAEKINNVMEEE